MSSITRGIVEKRYGEEKVEQDDMLGKFVRNGLNQRASEAELLGTMYVSPIA